MYECVTPQGPERAGEEFGSEHINDMKSTETVQVYRIRELHEHHRFVSIPSPQSPSIVLLYGLVSVLLLTHAVTLQNVISAFLFYVSLCKAVQLTGLCGAEMSNI